MRVNNAVPVSIVLEIIMVATHSSSTVAHNTSDSLRAAVIFIDDFYMTVSSIYVVVSIAWFIYLKNFDPTQKARLLRTYQGVILFLAGVAMTWVAIKVKTGEIDNIKNSFELRVVASVLAFGDATIYFFSPKSKSVRRRRHGQHVNTSFPSPDSNQQVYVISQDLPVYEPPPSYFDVHPELRQGDQSSIPVTQPVSSSLSPPPPSTILSV